MLVNHSLIIASIRTASWQDWQLLYSLSIANSASKERYEAKLQQIDGADSYEISMGEWSEDLNNYTLPCHIYIYMYIHCLEA